MKVTHLSPTLCNPMDYTVRGILQARILEWVAFPSSRTSSQPRDRTQVSHNAGGFFPSISEVKVAQLHPTLWPHGLYSPWNSPGQNTGVSRLSLLQGIFPTQESNPGLLPCKQIFYQLSYPGYFGVINILKIVILSKVVNVYRLSGLSQLSG